MVRYFRQIMNGSDPFEISKEEARRALDGNWKDEFLDDLFDNEKAFRLWNPASEVWTEKNGLVPMPGFYGVCE